MRKPKYDDKVVKMLEKSGGMKASEVAKHLDTRATTIYKVLTRLVEQKRILKDHHYFKANQDVITKTIANAASIASSTPVNKQKEDVVVVPKKIYESLETTAVKSTIQYEIEEVGKEIGQLTREMHILREIQNRLLSILERAR
jgi:DNA-binding transcriptional regulator GbsR (MarR family)